MYLQMIIARTWYCLFSATFDKALLLLKVLKSKSQGCKNTNLTKYHKNKLVFNPTTHLCINIYLALPFSHCITYTFYLQKKHIKAYLFNLSKIFIIALQFIKFTVTVVPLTVAYSIKINTYIVKFDPLIQAKTPQNCTIKCRHREIYILSILSLKLYFMRTYQVTIISF